MHQEDVFESLSQEREYQIQKWGDLDESNNVADFLAYMKRYLDKAFLDNHPRQPEFSMEHVRKMTALGVAAMEKFGQGLFVSHVNNFRGNLIYSPDGKTFEIALFWTLPVDTRYDGLFVEAKIEHKSGHISEATMGFAERLHLSMKGLQLNTNEVKSVTLTARSIDKRRYLQEVCASTPTVTLQVKP